MPRRRYATTMMSRNDNRKDRKNPDGAKERCQPGWFARMALEDGLKQGGCLVCQALHNASQRYLFSFLYEGMMSSEAREDFLRGGGFCKEHFGEAKAIEEQCWSDGFGVSILCENLLARGSEDWEKWIGSRTSIKPKFLGAFWDGAEAGYHRGLVIHCIACRLMRETEEHYLSTLEQVLAETAFAKAYGASAGLCLRHLAAAENIWESPEARIQIRTTAEQYVKRLIAELQEFQRLHDYRYRDEPRGEESTSPERAMDFLVGLWSLRAQLGQRKGARRRIAGTTRADKERLRGRRPELPER